MPYLCFPCLLDRGRKRFCPLGGAWLFPVPGGVGALLGGAPQILWYCEGPPCCYSFSAILFGNAERGGKCSALWVFHSNEAGGRRRQLDPNCLLFTLIWLRSSAFLPPMPLPNFLAVIFHGMLFSPRFRPCSSSTREPLFSWTAVSECCEKHCSSCRCLRLCLGMCQRGSVWPAPSELSSRAVGTL